ncbi:MAG TPA: RHS repeat-associated core domain-containing protein, partial [Candidatus Krumholzibacteriaceae bacterium]|nr:RHS repeat-associated core domain-containing protein [Candidatus Krumholzibacteriaceae bacterium]
IYSFDGKLLAEYNTSGVCVRDYIYMGNQLIAEYDPASSQYYYYTSDQINSTRIVTDGTGAVVYAAAHDPYGGIQKTWVSTFDPVPKFSGKEHDGESQLDYFGARYYDRSQYRFISVDPTIILDRAVNMPQMWNLYSLAGNSPVTTYDPTGRWWTTTVHGAYTYKIAKFAGLSDGLARIIAEADMSVDNNFWTASTWAGFFSADLRRYWHFPTKLELENARIICRTTLDPKEFGKYLHVIQDSYSHAGYDSTHVSNLAVDDPAYDWAVTMKMVWETLTLIEDFEQRLWEAVADLAASIVAYVSKQ